MNDYYEQKAEREAAKDWLMGLKEGDEVAIPDRSRYNRTPLITVVMRVTPTQLVVKEHATEVRYDDGTRRGTGYTKLAQVTDEVREAVEIAENRSWLHNLTYREDNVAKIPPAVLDTMRSAYTNAMALHNTAPNNEAP